MKKTILIATLLVLLSSCAKTPAPETVNYLTLQDTMPKEAGVRPAVKARESVNIEVPFFSQAPFANWDYPWQEACEEASVLNVVNVYLDKNYNLDSFNAEELRLIDWENSYFGDYKHTSVAQTAEMIESVYGLRTKILENPGFEDIRAILNNGNLIIAPFAGKLLGNPNFRNGGPNYHMLVIKGYDAESMEIITNDVGTRNGSNYVYSWKVIAEALHDWDDKNITSGAKKIIEVFPQ